MQRRALVLSLLVLALAGVDQARGQALKAPNVVAAIQGVPYLSTMLSALNAANLTQSLSLPTFNGTVIAPQDSGFANFTRLLGLPSPSDLLSPNNTDTLLKVLQYHVVPGAPLTPEALKNGQKLPTLLANEQLTIDLTTPGLTHIVGGSPYNVVTLLGYQLIQGNGAVVFVVDQVLVPPEVINASPAIAAVYQPALTTPGRR